MDPAPHSFPDADDLEHAQEVFARTLRFLARCAEDPTAAVAAEDPRALVRDLESLSFAAPPAPDPAEAQEESAVEPETRTLPLRRRRSA